jgi:hypothetical protein
VRGEGFSVWVSLFVREREGREGGGEGGGEGGRRGGGWGGRSTLGPCVESKLAMKVLNFAKMTYSIPHRLVRAFATVTYSNDLFF